jgi:acylpyruvate hydrolase
MAGKGGSVIRPPGETKLHYEVELALIMGKELKNLKAEDEESAMDAIEGYAVAIDMTARDAQDAAKKKGLPWTTAKGYDTFLPMSHFIPKAKIPDPYKAELFLQVNRETKQDDSITLMMFKIPRLLSAISSVMHLEPGDIVLTGTPKGVGQVKGGDVMRVGIRLNGKEIPEGVFEIPVKDA